MNRDTLNLPTTRTWRDIPQPVVPRAMSREGRWRFLMASLRITTGIAVVGVIGWGGWMVMGSVRENTRAMPAAAKASPIKTLELRTNGVLSQAWLARTLALPKTASLMELDLQKLQSRLLQEDQVLGASLMKALPDRLVVQISERSPVARLQVRWLGQDQTLLVARDGVIFAGEGFDERELSRLPYLIVSRESLVPDGGHFRPIAGMDVAAELLSKAGLEAEHLYARWFSVSLLRLRTDRRIDVTTKDGSVIAFSTTDDFFRQLAKLDTITDELAAKAPGSLATIDLTLGQNVPVTVIPVVTDPTTPASRPTPGRASNLAAAPAPEERAPRFDFARPNDAKSSPALFVLPHSQPKKTQREL